MAKEKLIISKARSRDAGEVFTPAETAKYMVECIPDIFWADGSKNTLEPTCGNGNLVLAILYKKVSRGLPVPQAISTTYGMDCMEDNILSLYSRVFHEFMTGMTPKQQKGLLAILLNNFRHVRLKGGGTLRLNPNRTFRNLRVAPAEYKQRLLELAQDNLALLDSGKLPESLLPPL